MNESLALQKAIPTTGFIEDKLINAFAARLRVATPQTGTVSTQTVASATGQDTTSSSNSTTTTNPGSVTNAGREFPFRSLSVSNLPPTGDASVLKGTTENNPMLEYLAATALYQEVKLINAYVDKAAIPKGFKPFIVRMQVTLNPMARNMPYDAYTTLSFFNESTGGGQQGTPKVAKEGEESGEEEGKRLDEPEMKNPRILPLLVTDSIEGALAAKSEERIRQFSLGLMAMLQGF